MEAQYDRDLRHKIDKRAEQRAVEAYNRKTTKERKLKAGAKRAKEELERFCLKNVSVQSVRTFEDQREEREALRRQKTKTDKPKQPDSGRCRFVVDMGETMCGNTFNTGFQFARSKALNDKAWRNTFDHVQLDWGTRKHLSRRWECILTRRIRHRKLQTIGMEDQKNKRRVFLFFMRVVATDGVRGRGKTSFWRPVVRENMFGYVSKVPGIGVDTGVLIQRTKRMPGVDRYDPPGRLCHWSEPIECSRHPFGFDWKARHAELARVCNLTDTPVNAELDYSDETDVIVTVQPLIDWRIMTEVFRRFRRWQRYEYDETSDESDKVSSSDNRDGRSAVGRVRGLSMGNDVELLQNLATWR